MSGLASNLLQGVSILLRTPRSIGTIVADVTFEETHRDDLEITDHPVEYGATISDHAFMRPVEVTIRCGWSNSSAQAALSSTILGVPTFGLLPSFSESYVTDVYTALQALQQSRTPFTIVTGKRMYEDMLIRSMTVTTDQETEYALAVTVVCRQVIIVQTVATTLPPASAQASPQDTAAQANTGTKATVPAPNQFALQSQFGS